MAAEIEDKLGSASGLIQGSGGIFEVEYKGRNVYSKKNTNRFPEDGEVLEIVRLIESGVGLLEAQKQAAENIKKPPTFVEWFGKKFGKH